jgi:steroid 5-alpha reductase family enzyme
MRLTWRDAAATLLVGTATAVYLGQKMSVSIPLITDRGDVAAAGLLLGFVACVIDDWTVTHAALVRTLSVFSVCTLGIGIAAMATESETLVTIVVAMLVTLWALTTLAHAGVIAQRANSEGPRRRAARPRPHRAG